MNTWTEEDREELAAAITDGMVSTMTFEELRNTVWDLIYDDVIHQEWSDIWMLAEDYAPDRLDG